MQTDALRACRTIRASCACTTAPDKLSPTCERGNWAMSKPTNRSRAADCEPVAIGSRLEPLVDDYLFAQQSLEGRTRAVATRSQVAPASAGQAEGGDADRRAWEGNACLYRTVMQDDQGLLRMKPDRRMAIRDGGSQINYPHGYYLSYAQSSDGNFQSCRWIVGASIVPGHAWSPAHRGRWTPHPANSLRTATAVRGRSQNLVRSRAAELGRWLGSISAPVIRAIFAKQPNGMRARFGKEEDIDFSERYLDFVAPVQGYFNITRPSELPDYTG